MVANIGMKQLYQGKFLCRIKNQCHSVFQQNSFLYQLVLLWLLSKNQGQMLDQVGVFLTKQPFTHGNCM